MTSSCGKEIEEKDNANVICLKDNLISSCRDIDNLSIGLHRSNEARERELISTKTTKGISHVRITLKDFFAFLQNIKIISLMVWFTN